LTPTGFDFSDATASQNKDLRNQAEPGAAQSGAARSGTESHGAPIDPDLGLVIETWPRLEAHLREAILALVRGR
jgi:hypothetical protein